MPKSNYYRNPAMIESERDFRCYNCNKQLIKHLEGIYEIKLQCPRCKTKITLICKEPITLNL